MKIYLLDRNSEIINAWKQYFADIEDVIIVQDDFGHFMDTTEVECIVSPANSYGLMDGGYDLAITEWFGEGLMKKVQEYILKSYRGEQPIASSFIVDTGIKGIKLIHTPSMRIPSVIKEPTIVYHCTRSALLTAMGNDVKSIVLPAFGGCCGCVPPEILSKMMYEACYQVMNPPKELDWEYATRWKPEQW